MSETPEPLSAEELEERLTAIRWQLRAVGEKLSNPLAALDALKSVDAKVKALIEDARAEQKESKA